MHDGLPSRRSEGGARRMLWAGREVFFDGKYPAVWWPDHPMSRRNGHLRIHRAVAAEAAGRDLASDEHVHHRNEDVWDWSQGNLAVMTNSEHATLHSGGGLDPVPCAKCGTPFKLTRARMLATAKPCCSRRCAGQAATKGNWPDDDSLVALLASNPVTTVGKMVGVTDNAVRHYARSRGIPVPKRGRGFWT